MQFSFTKNMDYGRCPFPSPIMTLFKSVFTNDGPRAPSFFLHIPLGLLGSDQEQIQSPSSLEHKGCSQSARFTKGVQHSRERGGVMELAGCIGGIIQHDPGHLGALK